MFLSPRGWAMLAWQSDYSQFYLIDRGDETFEAPVEITDEIEKQSYVAKPAGVVIYTQDSLNQHIHIAIYDTEPEQSPTEPISGRPWTRTETADVKFPSKSFGVSSPSMPDPLPNGPFFLVDSTDCTLRIDWMEDQGIRDFSGPTDPDIIHLTLRPRASRKETK
jgi:hypothetical protein